jgi:hypothetical protein
MTQLLLRKNALYHHIITQEKEAYHRALYELDGELQASGHIILALLSTHLRSLRVLLLLLHLRSLRFLRIKRINYSQLLRVLEIYTELSS